jgi:hypothetical protein
MDDARAAAVELAADGDVRILARGRALDPGQPLRGPIRIALVDSDGTR